jgi:hypothetical protein
VGGTGLLFRCFHIHPLALRVLRRSPRYLQPFSISLDEEYFPRLMEDMNRVYSVADSDEAAVCSLSSEAFTQILMPSHQRPDVRTLSQWAEENAALLHRQAVRRSYRWHDGTLDDAAFQSVDAESAAFVEQILERLAIPDMVLQIESPSAYEARRARIRRLRHWRKPDTNLSLTASELRSSHLLRIMCFRAYLRVGGFLGLVRLTAWLRARINSLSKQTPEWHPLEHLYLDDAEFGQESWSALLKELLRRHAPFVRRAFRLQQKSLPHP